VRADESAAPMPMVEARSDREGEAVREWLLAGATISRLLVLCCAVLCCERVSANEMEQTRVMPGC
jgi:hypothetical protein